ncbi:MAG: hypothetical protein Q8876_07700 [Bacillota bacterium]|nr:hypothetical protein [Bacillota bacterium]
MIETINATMLDSWSKQDPRRAQEILPELMIRLILCTSGNITSFNFPKEKGIQYAGYDGVLISAEQTNYFPIGKSVWEFGVETDTKSKFEDDIKKRSDNPLGEDIKETVFIFATLKIWNHKTSISDLINKSKVKYKWKDIQIFDACNISLWLEQCPSVSIWMLKIIGKHIEGLMTIEEFWDEYCLSTTPNLSKEFFLFGRELQSKQLCEWLNKGLGYNSLISESSLESILFIIATIMKIREDNQSPITYKVLIIDSISIWDETITAYGDKVLLIPHFNFTDEIRLYNAFVIFPVSKFSPFSKFVNDNECIEIAKRPKQILSKALELLGYKPDVSFEISSESKGGFLPFYRLITNVPIRKQPKWSSEQNINELIPALLAGGWKSDYEGDKEIIEKLSGLNYSSYIEKISKWSIKEDAPIFSIQNNYQIVSAQDLWSTLFIFIQREAIEKFKDCIIDVFKATKESNINKYSELIRKGLIINLIILADKNNTENHFNILSTEDFVYLLIRDLLAPIVTLDQWIMICPSLPLLTEASPKAIIEKLEIETSKPEAEFWNLFSSQEHLFLAMNKYNYILWALEILVWFKNYAVRAIMVLIKLSERNFIYKTMNTPLDSLYNIFCTWYPQSCLLIDERNLVLEKICEDYPRSGWNLIISLVPVYRSLCGPVQKPRWQKNDCTVTINEFSLSLNKVLELSLSLVQSNGLQWKDMISNISEYESIFTLYIEKCIKACSEMTEDDVIIVCDALREKIWGYKKFPDTEWVVTKGFLLKLEELLLLITPKSINTNKYLFKYYPKIIDPSPYLSATYEDDKRDEKIILQKREEVINTILEEYGLKKFIDFCKCIEDTKKVGDYLAIRLFNNKYDFNLLKRFKRINFGLYVSLINSLYNINGLDKLIDKLNKATSLSDIEKGEILCNIPITRIFKEKLINFNSNIIDFYWQNVNIYQISDMDLDLINFLSSRLLKYGRPNSAIQLLALSGYSDSELIITALESLVERIKLKKANEVLTYSDYDISTLFDKLCENENISELQVAQLEIFFLDIFDKNKTPKFLTLYLTKNPKEFVNFITYCYKKDEPTDKDNKKNPELANSALKVLNHFKKIPGCNDITVCKQTFNDWIDSAKQYSIKIGYSRAFEICLGCLLSYAIAGTDGIFPHEIIREFFECNYSPIIKNEFCIEKINQRGVYTCTNGVEETGIADNYFKNAATLRIKYPHTSMILDELGNLYKNDAQHEAIHTLMDYML